MAALLFWGKNLVYFYFIENGHFLTNQDAYPKVWWNIFTYFFSFLLQGLLQDPAPSLLELIIMKNTVSVQKRLLSTSTEDCKAFSVCKLQHLIHPSKLRDIFVKIFLNLPSVTAHFFFFCLYLVGIEQETSGFSALTTPPISFISAI